jgi:argininosuccinate lyase
MALKKVQLKQDIGTIEPKNLVNEEKLALASWAENENFNPTIESYTSTLADDYVLYPHVVDSLKAQFKMHIKRSIIPLEDGKQLIDALDKVQKELLGRKLNVGDYNSIYSLISARVSEIAPEAYQWYEVGRGAYGQVAGDLRLWTRDSIDVLEASIKDLQARLIEQCEGTVKTIYPAHSHSQLLQPSSLGHQLFAYVELLGRDRERLRDARVRVNAASYVSGDMLGTSLEVSREMVAKALDFDGVMVNAVDAVCSRDFAVEFMSAVSGAFLSLSQLAEQMITWHSSSCNYIKFASGLTEQDQVMPYKRNQIALEMMRAKSSKVVGNMMSVYTMMQSLPMQPSADLSCLLRPMREAADELKEALHTMSVLISGMSFNRKVMKEAASKNFSTAKDLVVWVMRKTGCTMSDANVKVRKIIDYAIEKGSKLSLLELGELQKFEPMIDEDIYSVLIPSRAMISRRSGGGSNPVQIRKALRHARRKYL